MLSARKIPAINTVTMATCEPEIAKMWTVPVAAKSLRKALGKSSRYPIISDCTMPRWSGKSSSPLPRISRQIRLRSMHQATSLFPCPPSRKKARSVSTTAWFCGRMNRPERRGTAGRTRPRRRHRSP